MHIAKPIDYLLAKKHFTEADKQGKKLNFGDTDTNFWLHKERLNLDVVIEHAKRYSDSKIFIISEGIHKGFYIYSDTQMVCLLLIEESPKISKPAIVLS